MYLCKPILLEISIFLLFSKRKPYMLLKKNTLFIKKLFLVLNQLMRYNVGEPMK